MADEKRFDRLEDKIDTVKESISRIDVTLAAQHESLKEHIRRTEMLEEEFKPVRNHVIRLQGIMKLLGVLALMAGIIEATMALLEYLRK